MSEQITVSQYIIRFLESKGITWIPGVPGGTILPLYESLAGSNIEHVLARHEQGAGFIAQGRARSTGEVSAVFVSSGPGVANLITAVADAQRDSVPLLIFSGQVPLGLMGTDAFQELPTVKIVSSVVKKVYLVEEPNQITEILEEAFLLCGEGKKGPVWIDLPKDIQTQKINLPENNIPFGGSSHLDFLEQVSKADPLSFESLDIFLDEFKSLLENSQFPLLYIGGGAKKEYLRLREFVSRFQIPAVTTLMGLGIFEKDDPMNLGMMGMHGTVAANEALGVCDLLIGIGVRFDDRATGAIEKFCNQAKIIHIDIDAREIGKNKSVTLSLQKDISEVLPFLLEEDFQVQNKESLLQVETWKQIPEEHPMKSILLDFASVLPSGEHFVLTDVGQHQMWVAQYFPLFHPMSWITSGGQGTMGFGLPTAIGVALSHRDSHVYCFTGDGSIMMNLQELSTLREQNLNVKIILINNEHLGLVKQQQDLFYGSLYSGSKFHFHPDFSMLCESFGIVYYEWDWRSEVQDLETVLEKKGPALVEVRVPSSWGVYPFVPGGKSNQEYILGQVTT
ncbi:biosynthetic-type acetolactate synthase large subunit [Leptospira bandrabouensis]|uniref:biosynthetic-type acetolactate synthase large subunit n=1 Tax=Leptospira bandrabouensis TaxID=2484903 RepID=UPI00223D5954|nr:biosynthetic-type acetolactate synthase large subunit [Leptospira bandrabouensis]MCW7458326.1 biosynthetic-type acetolactate synthase large subunit [Leptospira bandrabouensis]MCW7476988.1 biosynthetic-type acetolactate synthase large subunit [Leptospira bandrabouensis]MCW7484670.1 biosynthetic-type acetolactate synthase large subunit [Leptospira bandrabouensis]